MAGLGFQQLTVGPSINLDVRRTFAETDNVLLVTMTMNPAKIHLDAYYCREADDRTAALFSDTVQKAERHVP
jgi:acyl dehydratase